MADLTPPQLDYAPRPARHLTIVRRYGLKLILSTIAIVAVACAPPFIRRARLLYLQRKCLEYTADSTQRVFDSRVTTPVRQQPSDPGVGRHVSTGNVPYLGRVPAAWESFMAEISPPGIKSYGTVFLHRLHALHGAERLVAVDLNNPASGLPAFRIRVIALGNFFTRPTELSASTTCWPDIHFKFSEETEVFPPRLDAAAANHFSTRMVYQHSEVMLDGWLLDDDQVIIEKRRPSPTPPPPPSPASSR